MKLFDERKLFGLIVFLPLSVSFQVTNSNHGPRLIESTLHSISVNKQQEGPILLNRRRLTSLVPTVVASLLVSSSDLDFAWAGDDVVPAVDEEPINPSQEINDQGTFYVVPSAWIPAPAMNSFTDKFTEDRVAQRIAVAKTSTTLTSISDLGKIENVNAAKALGLDESYIRADLVACAKKKDSNDQLFYQWDLALAPKKCEAGDQFGGALGCSNNQVVLLSATVKDNQLVVLQINSNIDEWRKRGTSLRDLRNSFRTS